MGLFKSLFNKDSKPKKKGFFYAEIIDLVRETKDTVKVVLKLDAKDRFVVYPGQYINLSVDIDGKEERRSYSICSGRGEELAIGVKEVENGTVSKYLNQEVKVGDFIWISKAQGNFRIAQENKNIVAFAAGSGITPILSFAKHIAGVEGKMELLFANKTEEDIIFKKDIDALGDFVNTHYFLTQEEKEGFNSGRINQSSVSDFIKANLDILKADGFYFCGPEEMIASSIEALKVFGVSEDKMHYELFTTPTLLKSKETEVKAEFKGESQVTVILDDEETKFSMSSDGDTLLSELESEGIDAPYSCRGGVCSTCKAKVLKGAATMNMNYTLTDEEIADGYILTCQAHPNSEELIVTYDD